MTTPAIYVNQLRKVYEVPEREAGLFASIKSLVKRKVREVPAVAGVNFSIEAGEVVGFLGPNGAGKTTTLKMLSGLLYPTDGHAEVLGHTPSRREAEYLRKITLVMGNRNQLQWDLPALDSFELNRSIYHIPTEQFRQTRDDFIELLEVGDLVKKPVRNLSLGERMKMEIIAALLHRPQVLFLDEPTIGLDVTMQRRIRTFVADYNQRYGATVMLTSHYMADIEALCKRVIVIHHGRVIFDGGISGMLDRFAAHKKIVVGLSEPGHDLSLYGEVTKSEGQRITLQVIKAEVARVTARLLADLPVIDLSVEEPPFDEVIERVFNSEQSVSEEVV